MTEIVFDGKIGGALRENKGKDKKARRKGVPVRDYKKTKNILTGTPASESVKRVR